MNSVSVWDRRPTSRELLDDRLARGWRPRASPLKDGAQVLGYAACTVAPHGAGGDPPPPAA